MPERILARHGATSLAGENDSPDFAGLLRALGCAKRGMTQRLQDPRDLPADRVLGPGPCPRDLPAVRRFLAPAPFACAKTGEQGYAAPQLVEGEARELLQRYCRASAPRPLKLRVATRRRYPQLDNVGRDPCLPRARVDGLHFGGPSPTDLRRNVLCRTTFPVAGMIPACCHYKGHVQGNGARGHNSASIARLDGLFEHIWTKTHGDLF